VGLRLCVSMAAFDSDAVIKIAPQTASSVTRSRRDGSGQESLKEPQLSVAFQQYP